MLCQLLYLHAVKTFQINSPQKYDDKTKRFTEHYGLIPIGLNVHIILVSIIDDEIHYAIKSTTITENHVEVISAVQSITQEELTALIDDLP